MIPIGTAASAHVSAPFDPATLDTAVLLLRSKDLGAGGSNVTLWPDQSPRGNNATPPGTPPVVATGSTPSGGKSVAFTGQSLNLAKALTGIASAASSAAPAGSSFDASKAIDGNFTGNACLLPDSTTGSPQWLRLTLPAARAVTSYKMWGHASSTSYNPTDWKFQGTNDATFATWTDLDIRSGVTWASTSDVKNYSFSNTTSYLYYRFLITGNVSASDYTAICEVQLSEPEEAELWVVVKANSTTGNTNPWQFGNSSQITIYPWTTGQVIDNFATTTHSDLWTPTLAVTSWRLYRVKYHLGRMDIWMDNVLQKTKTGLTWGWRPNPQISNGFVGNMAEVFVSTGRELTSTETTNLISYFNAQHGLSVV